MYVCVLLSLLLFCFWVGGWGVCVLWLLVGNCYCMLFWVGVWIGEFVFADVGLIVLVWFGFGF